MVVFGKGRRLPAKCGLPSKQKDQREPGYQALAPLHIVRPGRRTQSLGPISPAVNRARESAERAGLRRADRRAGIHSPCTIQRHTGALSLPRPRFARFGPAPLFRAPFKSSSGTLGIWDSRHEAHCARRSGAERFAPHGPRTTGFAAALWQRPMSHPAGRSAGARWPLVAGADPFRPGRPRRRCFASKMLALQVIYEGLQTFIGVRGRLQRDG